MVYALATRGAAALVERGHLREIGDWRKKNHGLGTLYIAHQAMVANFRIALTLATREQRDVELMFFQPESHELRDRVIVAGVGAPQRYPINPDGFFGLRFPGRPEGSNRAFFFLEADRSTMTRERFVRKLEAYQAWYEADGHTKNLRIKNFRVLTVTKSEERMASLLRAAGDASSLQAALSRFWFTSETRFTPAGPQSIFTTICELPGQGGCRRSLLS
jgi:hypothetical protein